MQGFVDLDQAKSMLEKGARIVDVRTQAEWDEAHGAGSLHLPLDQVQARFGELPKDVPLLMCCRSGGRSAQATAFLQAQGYEAYNYGPWNRTADLNRP